MKKYLVLLMAAVMIFSFSGCGSTESSAVKMGKPVSSADAEPDGSHADIGKTTVGDEAPAEPADVPDAADSPSVDDAAPETPAQNPAEAGHGSGNPQHTNQNGGSQNGGSQSGGAQSGGSQSGGSQSGGSQSGGSQSGGSQNGGSQSGGSQNGGSQSGGSQNGGSQGGNTQPPKHEHDWTPVYGTVHHEEEGHYENVEVQPEWDEPQYEYWEVCNTCGEKFHGAEVGNHILDVHDGHGSYSTKQFVSGYIHHDAVYEKEWVVDTSAWDESVVTGYECICGEKKSA